jgi:hypothetical protein
MIFKLPEDQKLKVKKLFQKKQPNNSALWTYLNNDIPGQIFVDNLLNPTKAICVINFCNWAYISDNTDLIWLENTIQHICQNQYLQIVWNPSFFQYKPRRGLEATIPRYEYIERNTVSYKKNSNISVNIVDSNTFEKCEWKDIQILGYGTKKNFLNKAFAFCIIKDEQICCECYATFCAKNYLELGVLTTEKMRKQGFALTTCLKAIDESINRGFTPTWSCDKDNKESVNLAERLGFHSPMEYEFLYFPQKK